MRANLYLTTILGLGALTLAACGDAPETAEPAATAPTTEAGADMANSASARATSSETGTAELMNNDGESIGTVSLTQAPTGLLNPEGPDDGDLPNIHAGEDGMVRAELFTGSARLAENGPGQWLWDEDGSAVVIHASPDDHRSQPIGGAGDRVACAVIAQN